MAIKEIKRLNNGLGEYVREFICDLTSDLADMPNATNNVAIGSTVLCLENKTKYILSVGDIWKQFETPKADLIDGYDGVATTTADTTVNNIDKTIEVDVIKVPHVLTILDENTNVTSTFDGSDDVNITINSGGTPIDLPISGDDVVLTSVDFDMQTATENTATHFIQQYGTTVANFMTFYLPLIPNVVDFLNNGSLPYAFISGAFEDNVYQIGYGHDNVTRASNQVVLGNSDVDSFRLGGTLRTISSSTETGQIGEFCYDADYLYMCVATDTWKRVALSTW